MKMKNHPKSNKGIDTKSLVGWGLIMLKKLLAAGFICLFVVILGFARSGYAQEDECFQGRFYLYGEVANDSNVADPSYGHLIDTGLCGFVRCADNSNILVQLILAEEDSNDATNDNNIYFAIVDPCEKGSRGKFICAIDEFEIEDFMGTGYRAIVHGGNAVVTKHNKRDGSIVVKGKFLAGPEGSEGQDPHPETMLMFAHMHFVIFTVPVPCPPYDVRGCDPWKGED